MELTNTFYMCIQSRVINNSVHIFIAYCLKMLNKEELKCNNFQEATVLNCTAFFKQNESADFRKTRTLLEGGG